MAKEAGRKKRNKGNAYMTVEASLILPLAVMLCAFLIMLSFYLYAVCFLNQAAYIAAFRGSLYVHEGTGSRQAAAEAALEELLEQKILPVQNLEKEVSASAVSVRVVLRAEFALPGTGILPVEPDLQIRAEKKALVRDAVCYIRLMRKLEAGGSGE